MNISVLIKLFGFALARRFWTGPYLAELINRYLQPDFIDFYALLWERDSNRYLQNMILCRNIEDYFFFIIQI